MGSNLNYQEAIAQHFYSYSKQNLFYCCEDNVELCLYKLMTHRSSGLLLLINQLLDSNYCQKKIPLRNFFLAKKLIENFHRIRVKIQPCDEQKIISFISKMFSEAVFFSTENHQGVIHKKAKKLVHSLNQYQFEFTENSYSNLAKTWEEFSLEFLNSKLNIYEVLERT